MILPLIIVIVMAGLPFSSVSALQDPAYFRGVPWGASEAELREKIGGESQGPRGRISGVYRCHDYSAKLRWLGDRQCDGSFYLGSVFVSASYSFRNDKFARAMLTFRPEEFSEIERIILERYGPPTSQADLPIKTRGGAELTNRTLKWTGPLVLISLQRYLGKVTESGASLSTVEENQEAARLRGKDVKDAAKGL